MTNAELAILSLIVEQPRHGYDIEQIIEARGMRDWTEIGFSSIYYLLPKLEKEALIESELQQPEGKGPARKVYKITRKGQQVHREGALAALSMPQSVSSSFLLGLSNFPALPRGQVLAALDSYAEEVGERLTHMQQRANEQSPLPPFVQAMFNYSQALAEAELNWIQNFKQELEAENV